MSSGAVGLAHLVAMQSCRWVTFASRVSREMQAGRARCASPLPCSVPFDKY